jgi:predicted MFS family arabinose efflux permease
MDGGSLPLHTVSEMADTSPARADGRTSGDGVQWFAFTLVCTSYLAVTVGEQLLSPLFPVARDELGLSLADGGIAFGVLTASIAIANLIGGAWLTRTGPLTTIRASTVATMVGSVIAATADGLGQLVIAQVFMGLGAGLFFPGGLQLIARLAGPNRRGMAMGIYGVAFSIALTVAAVLGAAGASQGWRIAFWIGGGIALVALAASGAIREGREPGPHPGPIDWRAVAGLPTVVGAVGAVCQYGSIPFLTTYAVDRWGLREASAALLLAAGRVVSIAAKLIAGASADRIGPMRSAQRTSLVLMATGLGWVLLPGGWITYAIAAIFAGTVSSLFPIANLLAVERFGRHGGALGAYRSAQIGFGALAGFAIGLLGEQVGLRPVLAVAALAPAVLIWACRPVRR